MISLDEAQERVIDLAVPLDNATIPLQEAAGRVLALPAVARTSQPPFDASAMDGYAVRAEDVSGGAALEMVGTSEAGSGYDQRLGQDRCVRIFTGAPVPEGADTVIMQENAKAKGNWITFADTADVGQHIRTRGQDFSEGDVLCAPGQLMTPAAIAVAAAGNCARVDVRQQPKVALLATGNELVPLGGELAKDQIISSNSMGLAAMLAPLTASIKDYGIAGDTEEALRAKLAEALDSDVNVVITTGGVSVGDHDIVQPVLKSLGVEIDFWKISMRPGKPVLFGKKGKTLVFGLPGNPVSALITAAILVRPALRAMVGQSDPIGPMLRLPLATALPANGPRRHLMRAIISAKDDGISAVHPLSATDSAHLSSFAKANALIIHHENAPAQPVGNIVDVIQLW